MSRSIQPWKHGLAASLALATVPLAAQTTVQGEYCILRTVFDAEHPVGSDVPKEALREAVMEGGFNAAARLLKSEGEVEMVRRGTLEALGNGSARAFYGEEVPFVTTRHDPSQNSRSVSQSTISSGVTIGIQLEAEEEGTSITYDVDMDFAYPVEAESGGQEMTLIGRERMGFDGATTIGEEGVIVIRNGQSREGKPTEYVLLLHLTVE